MEKNTDDLITCLNKYGLVDTFDALQAINSETNKMIRSRGSLQTYEERFEFDLFAFSYYILYVIENEYEKFDDFQNIIILFYSRLAERISNTTQIYDSFLGRNMKDNEQYIIEKIQAYQKEFVTISENPEYVSKYIFASFYLFPFTKPESIKKGCGKIIDEKIKDFQIELVGTILMLEKNTKNLRNYVNFQ